MGSRTMDENEDEEDSISGFGFLISDFISPWSFRASSFTSLLPVHRMGSRTMDENEDEEDSISSFGFLISDFISP